MRKRNTLAAPREGQEALAQAKEFFSQLPEGRTLGQLLQSTAQELAITIDIHRCDGAEWDQLTGFLVAGTGRADIFIRETHPITYQCRVVLHEIGHLLCGHGGCSGLIPSAAGTFLATVEDGIRLPPLVDPDLPLDPDLGTQEREAEEVARVAEVRLLRPRYAPDELAWGAA